MYFSEAPSMIRLALGAKSRGPTWDCLCVTNINILEMTW